MKLDGALLNHIRPEFLLNYADYIMYIKDLNLFDTAYVSL